MSRSRKSPILFGAVFLFVGALLVFIGGLIFLGEVRYRQQGVRSQAVTLSKVLHRATSDTGTSYDVSYRFSAADGSSHEQTESVPVHVWESVEEGSPLTVEYIAGELESVRVVRANSDDPLIAIVVLSAGGLMGLIGLTVLTGALLRRRAQEGTLGPTHAALTQQPESAQIPPAAKDSRVASFWSLSRRSFGLWFGGIFLVCGLPLFLSSVFLFYDDWRFAQEARSTQGMVLTKDIRESRRRK
jgi:hypothetical protein